MMSEKEALGSPRHFLDISSTRSIRKSSESPCYCKSVSEVEITGSLISLTVLTVGIIVFGLVAGVAQQNDFYFC